MRICSCEVGKPRSQLIIKPHIYSDINKLGLIITYDITQPQRADTEKVYC